NVDCLHHLILRDQFGDGWNGNANMVVNISGNPLTYFLAGGGADTVAFLVTTGDSLALIYTAGTEWNSENSFELYDETWQILYDSPLGPATDTVHQRLVSCGGQFPTHTVSWSPTTGLTHPDSATTTIAPPAAGWYLLTASTPPACTATDRVLVTDLGRTGTLTCDPASNWLSFEP